MNDKSLKILLGIIAVNLTLQTINQIDLFPTADAQEIHSNGFSVTVAGTDDGVWYKNSDNMFNGGAVYCTASIGLPTCTVVPTDR